MNRTPDPETLPDGVLVIRALAPEGTGEGYLYRLTWGRDGEPASHAAADPDELHRLVDQWLERLRHAT